MIKTIHLLLVLVVLLWFHASFSHEPPANYPTREEIKKLREDIRNLHNFYGKVSTETDLKKRKKLFNEHFKMMKKHLDNMGKMFDNVGMKGEGNHSSENPHPESEVMNQMGLVHALMGSMMSYMTSHYHNCYPKDHLSMEERIELNQPGAKSQKKP